MSVSDRTEQCCLKRGPRDSLSGLQTKSLGSHWLSQHRRSALFCPHETVPSFTEKCLPRENRRKILLCFKEIARYVFVCCLTYTMSAQAVKSMKSVLAEQLRPSVCACTGCSQAPVVPVNTQSQ